MGRRFAGFVLAGGASNRMGTDKAFVDIGGRPLIAIVAAALGEAGQLAVIGGDEDRIRALGLDAHADDEPGAGPLAALAVGLRECREELAVVAACDLPLLSARAIDHLLAGLGDADCIVPIVRGHRQWHVTAWRRSSALAAVTRALAVGERSLRAPAAELRTAVLLDTSDAWYADADTPAELAALGAQP